MRQSNNTWAGLRGSGPGHGHGHRHARQARRVYSSRQGTFAAVVFLWKGWCNPCVHSCAKVAAPLMPSVCCRLALPLPFVCCRLALPLPASSATASTRTVCAPQTRSLVPAAKFLCTLAAAGPCSTYCGMAGDPCSTYCAMAGAIRMTPPTATLSP